MLVHWLQRLARSEGLPGGDKQMDKWMDGRTDGRMDRQKISPFFRTLSPTVAAALLQQRKLKSNKLESRARELLTISEIEVKAQ